MSRNVEVEVPAGKTEDALRAALQAAGGSVNKMTSTASGNKVTLIFSDKFPKDVEAKVVEAAKKAAPVVAAPKAPAPAPAPKAAAPAPAPKAPAPAPAPKAPAPAPKAAPEAKK